jgi:glycosyltransferase involved in cell wall biosynthesis
MEALGLSEKGLIDYFCLLMESDVKVLSKHNDKFTFVPVWMDTSELNNIEPDIFTGKHCDLFCGPCPRKNLIAQMVALSSIPDLHVHTNMPQHPNNLMYENFSQKMIGVNCVSHKWLSRPNYLKLCKSMTFGMQVSLSESFNYTAAEHMYLGVPVLMSNVSPMVKGLPKELIVDNPNDVVEIADKASRLMNDDYRAEASSICKTHIENYNANSKKALIATLSKMLGV